LYLHSIESVTVQREPTIDEFYKDTHRHKTKDKHGNWVCKKSGLRLIRSNSNYGKMSFQLKDGSRLTDLLFQTSNVCVCICRRSTQRDGKSAGPPRPPPMTVPKALHSLSTTFGFKEISLARVTCMALVLREL